MHIQVESILSKSHCCAFFLINQSYWFVFIFGLCEHKMPKVNLKWVQIAFRIRLLLWLPAFFMIIFLSLHRKLHAFIIKNCNEIRTSFKILLPKINASLQATARKMISHNHEYVHWFFYGYGNFNSSLSVGISFFGSISNIDIIFFSKYHKFYWWLFCTPLDPLVT